MYSHILSRRNLLRTGMAGLGIMNMPSVQNESETGISFPEKTSLSKKYLARVRASHRKILNELKPTRAQLEHGLDLHFSSFAADVQGSQNVMYPYGLNGERFERDLQEVRKRIEAEAQSQGRELSGLEKRDINRKIEIEGRSLKAFDAAFDSTCRDDQRELYRLTGMNLGTQDVAHPSEDNFEKALKHVTRTEFVYNNTKNVLRISTAGDLKQIETGEKPGMIYHLAGAGCFAGAENPVENLDLFYALGIRMSQLTYWQENALCCSWLQGEDSGLKPMGREIVRRMNELGIMVDLAHAGLKTSYDVIDFSKDPVLVSHTACRSLFDPVNSKVRYFDNIFNQDFMKGVPKPDRPNGNINVEDEVMRQIGAKGGLIGFLTLGHLYVEPGKEYTFNEFARHLEHAAAIAGIGSVGIGSDRGFFPGRKPHSMDWENWPYYTVGLVCRGWSDDEIKKVIGGNYLRFAKQVLDKKPWGKFI